MQSINQIFQGHFTLHSKDIIAMMRAAVRESFSYNLVSMYVLSPAIDVLGTVLGTGP